MQRRTVLLLPSSDCGWTELRLALSAIPNIEVEQLEGAANGEDALRVVADLQPDVVIAATRIKSEPILPLLRELHRRASPASRLVLITPRFTRDELAQGQDTGIVGHLQWSELHPPILRYLLEALIFDDIVIVSREVVAAFAATRRCIPRPATSPVELSPHERIVLRTCGRPEPAAISVPP